MMLALRRTLTVFFAAIALAVLGAAPALANCVEHAVCYGDLDIPECHEVLGR